MDWSKHPGMAYALKRNILYPGTQANADALERVGEDEAEAILGLTANELLNKFVITPG